MEDDLYDEFGNYIGPEVEEEEVSALPCVTRLTHPPTLRERGRYVVSRPKHSPPSFPPLPKSQDGGAAGADEELDDRPAWLRERDAEEEEDDRDGAGSRAGPRGSSSASASDALIAHAGAAAGASSSIVLHEDKKYYPDAEEVYPEAETLVQDEDTQPLSQPIIAPTKVKTFSLLDREPPATAARPEFLGALMSTPALIRNVAVVGHLHHGKTTLLDTLIEATHEAPWDPARETRYTMARTDEQQRGVSIKATPVSLVLQDERGKSFLLNALDTPGHVNFSDEVTASLRAADGAVVVVDAVEGVMLQTERVIRQALDAHLPLTLVISKVDRLILELKLPPTDAYFKLVHILSEVNALIAAHSTGAHPHPELSPADGNVAFAGSLHGWAFTLESFARLYVDRFFPGAGPGGSGGSGVDPVQLARRFWGDIYYDEASRKFVSKAPGGPGSPRSFVRFILEPLYKLYAQALGEEVDVLAATLAELRVRLTKTQLALDPKPLLRLVFRQFLGSADGLASMLFRHVPSPVAGAAAKVDRLYQGDLDAPEADSMRACDAAGTLVVNVVKLIPSPDGARFFALGRVMSGTLVAGQAVRVLGESYTAEDAEDVASASVTGLSIGQARWRQDVDRVPAGNWALIEGVDSPISKTATLTSTGPEAADVATFRPLQFDTLACVNISVEPLNPSELPKVLAGLRAVQKSYPLARTRVEESGEHVLIGTGELALDSMLHDLRELFGKVEVKVADPVVSFSETVVEQSSVQCFADTPNKKNRLTMMAEPLEKGESGLGARFRQWGVGELGTKPPLAHQCPPHTFSRRVSLPPTTPPLFLPPQASPRTSSPAPSTSGGRRRSWAASSRPSSGGTSSRPAPSGPLAPGSGGPTSSSTTRSPRRWTSGSSPPSRRASSRASSGRAARARCATSRCATSSSSSPTAASRPSPSPGAGGR
jgi:U5 small nuclear ribonucleoprotein component